MLHYFRTFQIQQKEKVVEKIVMCRDEDVERERALNAAPQEEVAKLKSALEAIRGENNHLTNQ